MSYNRPSIFGTDQEGTQRRHCERCDRVVQVEMGDIRNFQHGVQSYVTPILCPSLIRYRSIQLCDQFEHQRIQLFGEQFKLDIQWRVSNRLESYAKPQPHANFIYNGNIRKPYLSRDVGTSTHREPIRFFSPRSHALSRSQPTIRFQPGTTNTKSVGTNVTTAQLHQCKQCVKAHRNNPALTQFVERQLHEWTNSRTPTTGQSVSYGATQWYKPSAEPCPFFAFIQYQRRRSRRGPT